MGFDKRHNWLCKWFGLVVMLIYAIKLFNLDELSRWHLTFMECMGRYGCRSSYASIARNCAIRYWINWNTLASLDSSRRDRIPSVGVWNEQSFCKQDVESKKHFKVTFKPNRPNPLCLGLLGYWRGMTLCFWKTALNDAGGSNTSFTEPSGVDL